jgi:hypothetical protein
MAENHLEQLISEFYEYRGYFIRRNILVGKREKGGHECELDIVAFHPQKKHLVHLEPSLDADSWETREKRYVKKFNAGRKYIPALFSGFDVPKDMEQIAVFFFGSKQNHQTIGGGKITLVEELIEEILLEIKGKPLASQAIPEHFPLLRTLQYAVEYQKIFTKVLS